MIGILTFETAHGMVAVEVDEAVARAAGGAPGSGLVAKGALDAGEVVAHAPRSFSEAMGTFRACAVGLQDLVRGLEVAPEEVGVEFRLKLTGSAGFVIAKAGAESEMKVALTWKPRRREG